MTNIYFKHANGNIMEVQNWKTLTDYGAMIIRPLEPDECKRYLALKAIHLKDSEIWRLFHPHSTESSRSSPPSSSTSTSYSTHQQSTQPQLIRSSTNRFDLNQPIDIQIHNIPNKINSTNSGAAIEISIRDLSKRALLHIIQKACSRDIEALKAATHEELLSLASAILPAKGVQITVLPSMGSLASYA
ncbi:MAG: hypothetical protein AAGD25_26735 [Cyanobacteria bacterium P01_F01_bin.150]